MTLHIIKKVGLKLNIRVYYAVMKDIVIKVIIGLSALALVLLIACIALELQYTRYYTEVGSEITAEDIMGAGATFADDFDPEYLNRAGVHYFTVITGMGERRIRLRVIDTKAPKITVKDVKVALSGGLPRPEDFIDSVYEPDEFKGEYLSAPKDIMRVGKYNARVRFTDASGNKTQIFNVEFEVVADYTLPKVEVISPVIVERGKAVDYSSYVKVTDECVGELHFEVDEGELDTLTVGDYTVYVTGIDAIGNESERVPLKVKVVEPSESESESEK